MPRRTFLTAVLLLAPALAGAEPLTIDLPGVATRETVTYSCDGDRKVSAEYVNVGSNSLAVLAVGDQTMLMVNVLAASGARYAGQQYVWWTKGDTADFYDLTKGEDAPPVFSCKAG